MRQGQPVSCCIFLVFLLVLVAAVVHESWPVAGSHRRVETVIQDRLQTAFEQNRQKLFDSLHPTGTVTGVAVQEVTITAWKQGLPTNRIGDIRQFAVRLTLYWKSPLRPDGYTTIRLVFDTAAGRCTEEQVLATNGAPGTEAGELTGYLASTLIYGALTR